eukprot:UN08660
MAMPNINVLVKQIKPATIGRLNALFASADWDEQSDTAARRILACCPKCRAEQPMIDGLEICNIDDLVNHFVVLEGKFVKEITKVKVWRIAALAKYMKDHPGKFKKF